MFRMVSPSIIRSLRLYILNHIIQVTWLLGSKQPQNLYVIYLMMYVVSPKRNRTFEIARQ